MCTYIQKSAYYGSHVKIDNLADFLRFNITKLIIFSQWVYNNLYIDTCMVHVIVCLFVCVCSRMQPVTSVFSILFCSEK